MESKLKDIFAKDIKNKWQSELFQIILDHKTNKYIQFIGSNSKPEQLKIALDMKPEELHSLISAANVVITAISQHRIKRMENFQKNGSDINAFLKENIEYNKEVKNYTSVIQADLIEFARQQK